MKLILRLVAFLLLATPAFAWTHGTTSTGPATGNSLMNLSLSGNAPTFINIWKATQPTFNGGATPATMRLDANFNPTQSFTGSLAMALASSAIPWPGDYWIYADQGITNTITVSNPASCNSVTGITFTGSCSGIGSTATVTMDTSGGAAFASFTSNPGMTFTHRHRHLCSAKPQHGIMGDHPQGGQ
jgi:hypothetical protein